MIIIIIIIIILSLFPSLHQSKPLNNYNKILKKKRPRWA